MAVEDTAGCEDRTRVREAEESPLLEVVFRERLLKTLQVVKIEPECGKLKNLHCYKPFLENGC
jgi:hypothetical protein